MPTSTCPKRFYFPPTEHVEQCLEPPEHDGPHRLYDPFRRHEWLIQWLDDPIANLFGPEARRS